MSTPRKALFLSPHPDDTDLGASGTMAKLKDDGFEIFAGVFSNCAESLPSNSSTILIDEFHTALDRLNVPKQNRFIFQYKVRHFNFHRQEILEDLIEIKNKIQPTTVFVPASTDCHQDHHVIHEEGVRAFGRSSNVYGYELPWNMRSFESRHFVGLSEAHMKQKLHMIHSYQSQISLNRSYFSDDFIYSLAKVRGIQSGQQYAEAFEVLTSIG